MAGEAEQPAEAESIADGAAAFAKKAKDLEALRTAVIDAANLGAGLWLSYLFLLFYLAVAAGSVTHRNLLFEDPVKLPFLNVDLSLIGFFVLGPGIFLIVHAYVLLHFVLLADKVGAFHAELQSQINDDDTRARLRRQLPSNIFVQFLAGPQQVRIGVIGFLLRLIAQISLVVGPLALLVFFQLQFLPYHQPWWQRLAVVADLVLLWILWPSVARGEITRLKWRDLRRSNVAAPALASLLPIVLVFSIGTFPGEWLDTRLPSVKLVPTKLGLGLMNWASVGWTSLHELLVEGEIDIIARKPTSPWSNRLVLPYVMTDHSKSVTSAANGTPPEALSLRGRRLEAAVLVGAHFRNADFTAARLQGANLSGADLQEAKFECVGPPLHESCAQLQGASLDRAQLQGATLYGAQLQGASLDRAQLQGASLDRAQLLGASLAGAQLQGASLDRAQLHGASLAGAQLQGASLYGARLQGASLAGAQLQGATLEKIVAWRTDVRHAQAKSVRVVAPETGQCRVGPNGQLLNPITCLFSSFEALRALIEQVPAGERHDAALKQIEVLNPGKLLDDEEAMAKAWEQLARSSAAPEAYAEALRQTGCDERASPYIIRGLLRNLDRRFGSDSPQPSAIAGAFLDDTHCRSASGLLEDDKAKLREIRDRPLPAMSGSPAR
jgi:uncharacterized protein YjbI with pentapeptide repeats